jgi:hypothetical protein
MTHAHFLRFAGASLAVAALLVSGCSAKNTDDAGCATQEPPAACPAAVPSWSGEVSEIFMTRCSPCHFPGGVEDSAEDFSTYTGVSRIAVTIEGQIVSCAMPPDDAGALSAADRETLLAWIVCRAPDN